MGSHEANKAYPSILKYKLSTEALYFKKENENSVFSAVIVLKQNGKACR
jgi:hypothetical protein